VEPAKRAYAERLCPRFLRGVGINVRYAGCRHLATWFPRKSYCNAPGSGVRGITGCHLMRAARSRRLSGDGVITLLRSDSGRLADHTDLIEELRPWLFSRGLHSSSVLPTPGFSPADYGTLRQARTAASNNGGEGRTESSQGSTGTRARCRAALSISKHPEPER
jgi:hypothetical protein